MNWVDLTIILTILLFATRGTQRGFFAQVIDILGFIVALTVSLSFYTQAGNFISKFFSLPKIIVSPLGFLFLWILTETAFFAVFRLLFAKYLIKLENLTINKYLGIIPAALNAILLISFALLFAISLPIRADLKKDILNSQLGSPLINAVTLIERPLNNVFGPITKQSLTFLTVKPEDKGTIDLGYSQRELTVDLASERQMFELVNQERAKVGTKPLVWDEKLAQVGREHSRDMFERGYFSHYSPEGKDVGDRLLDAGIDYTVAGENLALAPDVERAHNGLMNSPGHKRNILDPAFTKFGVGTIDGGVYGKMFTQVFTN